MTRVAKRKHLVSAAKSRASKSTNVVIYGSGGPSLSSIEHMALVRGLRLVSPNSQRREHWTQRSRRVSKERAAVAVHLLALRNKPSLPVVVTLVHIAPRRMDSDNSVGALKGVRDEVALWLGVDDGSELITWHYAQQTGEYGVLIAMETVGKMAAGGSNG
jgi:hypothetical protein